MLASIQLIVYSRSVKSVYLMHPRCWDILLQQHALVAPPTKTGLDLSLLAKVFLQIPLNESGGGFRPDWATDYAGPEEFWWVGELETFQQASWHFLAHDPGIARGFDESLPPIRRSNLPPIVHLESSLLTTEATFSPDFPQKFSRRFLCFYLLPQCAICSLLQGEWHPST